MPHPDLFCEIQLDLVAVGKTIGAIDRIALAAQLVEMYAAYLYRKRREATAEMPRMLRWALNNRVFSGKVRADG